MRRALAAAFLLSGAAALVYEVAWTRLLGLFMGHTVAATTTVLSAFMAGLAGGSALAGRLAPALSRAAALRAYSALEVAIALLALAVPLELAAVHPLLVAAYADGQGGPAFAAARFFVAAATVALPAAAMGATLPFALRGTGTATPLSGADTGLLYGANTAGAALGALAAGFLLLPSLGLTATTIVAAALNVAAALVGLWTARRAAAPEATRHPPAAPAGRAARTPRRPASTGGRPAPAPAPTQVSMPFVAAAAVAAAGAASLILQIAWTRILAQVVGPTTYAFTVIVTIFIAGLAAGAAAGGRLARRGAAAGALAVALATSALFAGVAIGRVPDLTLAVADLVSRPDASLMRVTMQQAWYVAALLLPATIGAGAAFPLAVAAAGAWSGAVSRNVARLYTANTLGAIAGALAAGFWLVPAAGLERTAQLATAGLAAASLWVAARHGIRRRASLAAAAAATAAVAAVALTPRWDPALVSSGAYKYAAFVPPDHRAAVLAAGELLYYREGAAATVAVRRVGGATSLAIDGKVDASNAGDMLTQRLLAHVPLLLHRAPERVAVIGLGSGVTLGSALRHPARKVDALEISPEVVAASTFFAGEHGRALDDPRTRLLVADGRTHLTLGRGRYDVVISEPSNPWMAGIAGLFTREFFAAVGARLAPGGLFCQWAHTYDISRENLQSIVATFNASFADTMLWLVGDGDLLLVGSDEPLAARLEAMRDGWSRPGVAADLAGVGVTAPEVLWPLWAAGRADLEAFAGTGPAIQTDDRLALEFSAPESIYGRSRADHAGALRGLSTPAATPAIVRSARADSRFDADRGAMWRQAEAYGQAVASFIRALEQDPANLGAARGLVDAAAAANQLDQAELALRTRTRAAPDAAAVAVALSRLLAGKGDWAGAREALAAHARPPSAPLEVLDQAASVAADAGPATDLAPLVAVLTARHAGSEQAAYYAATLDLLEGRASQAAASLEAAVARRPPGSARLLRLLASAYAALGRTDQARQSLVAARAADPRDVAAIEGLGLLLMESGRAAEARRLFAEALVLDPRSPAARDGLSRTSAR